MANNGNKVYLGEFKVRRYRNGWGRYEYLVVIPAGYIHKHGIPKRVEIYKEDNALVVKPVEFESNV